MKKERLYFAFRGEAMKLHLRNITIVALYQCFWLIIAIQLILQDYPKYIAKHLYKGITYFILQ